MNGLVVSLCDLTGNVVRPWAEAGYECVCYDLQHPLRTPREERVGAGIIRFAWADVRSMARTRDAVFVACAPPCTDTAVSGARDFKAKGLRRLIDALEVVEACRMFCEWGDAPWMIEQPVGTITISTYWRDPDHRFDPCDYGDPYTKKTCLWVGNGFVMPPKCRVEPLEGSRMHLMAPSAERANLRSATPMGFARAVFAANAKEQRAVA